jgi:hypothetical protein
MDYKLKVLMMPLVLHIFLLKLMKAGQYISFFILKINIKILIFTDYNLILILYINN